MAFYNLGVLQSLFDGKKGPQTFLNRLKADVSTLWHDQSLYALFLCELGEHVKGLSESSRTMITNTIRSAIQPSGVPDPSLQIFFKTHTSRF